ncbi:ABC transporter permease [Paracraurococcus lichenis]|uniref:ABC transporter permease subunit n=1 Tax=Paracraurococcus lichenis TaxID=3064888 RepID=A0ABT9E634_9PROT|nr:ABC transporter permease subunit [Paracraurococcus sp. LOR1-02]MDO9711450.1 ABC transporter permease subunit [Paracraurococcus sp. LOR1-02]
MSGNTVPDLAVRALPPTAAMAGQQARPWPELIDLSPVGERSRLRDRLLRWRGRLLRVVVPALLLVAWQLASVSGLVVAEVLPPPTAIAAAFVELLTLGDLQAALPVSLSRSLTGLAIGGSIGLTLGLVSGLWRLGEEIFDAPLQMLRTIPFIALVPLFIVWFGIDEYAKIVVITAATIFPIYLNTYAGVRGIDPKLLEAARTFGLGGWRTIRHVILPVSLPAILVGLRYSAGVSLLALVVAEQINARTGLGYILNNANMNQRSDIIIVGILVYAALGIVTDLVMRGIERLALPWRPNIALN